MGWEFIETATPWNVGNANKAILAVVIVVFHLNEDALTDYVLVCEFTEYSTVCKFAYSRSSHFMDISTISNVTYMLH